MGNNDQTRLSEESVERRFLEAALKWSRLSRPNTDPKQANKQFNKLHKLFKSEIRRLPDRGATALKRISKVDDLAVQTIAAAALLAVDEPFATELLERIRDNHSGLISVDAEMTLKEWRKGAIREYWS